MLKVVRIWRWLMMQNRRGLAHVRSGRQAALLHILFAGTQNGAQKCHPVFGVVAAIGPLNPADGQV
jgi:hypothetical protein